MGCVGHTVNQSHIDFRKLVHISPRPRSIDCLHSPIFSPGRRGIPVIAIPSVFREKFFPALFILFRIRIDFRYDIEICLFHNIIVTDLFHFVFQLIISHGFLKRQFIDSDISHGRLHRYRQRCQIRINDLFVCLFPKHDDNLSVKIKESIFLMEVYFFIFCRKFLRL